MTQNLSDAYSLMLYILFVAVVLSGFYNISKIGRRPKNYPPGIYEKAADLAAQWCPTNSDCLPGPPTLPIIGNLHQMPRRDLHLAYDKWAQQCKSFLTFCRPEADSSDGPIYSLKLGQTTLIVLANGDLIKKLIDKRSANYADRQNIYMRGLWEDSRIIMRGQARHVCHSPLY